MCTLGFDDFLRSNFACSMLGVLPCAVLLMHLLTQKLLAMLGDMARGDPEQAPNCPKGLIFMGLFCRSARVRSIKAHFVPKEDEKTRGQ